MSNVNQEDVNDYYHYFIDSYIKENPLLEMFRDNKIIVNDNEIKIVHGLPYKPHSQGVYEIVNKAIRIGLIVKKLKN